MATQEGLRSAAGARQRRTSLWERLMRRARRSPLMWVLSARRISDEERELFMRNVANDPEIERALNEVLAARPHLRRTQG